MRRRRPPTGELMEVETRDGRGSEEGRSEGRSGGRQSSIAASSALRSYRSQAGRRASASSGLLAADWTGNQGIRNRHVGGPPVGSSWGLPPSACACPARIGVVACISVTVLGQGPHHGRLTRSAKDRPWRGACKLHYKRPLAMCVRARRESTEYRGRPHGSPMYAGSLQVLQASTGLVSTSIDASLNVLARPWRIPLGAGSPADCTHVPASLAMTRPGPAAMIAPSRSPSQQDGTDRVDPALLSPPQPINHARPSMPIGQHQRDIAGRGHGPRHRSASPLRKADDGRPAPGISMDTRDGSWQPAVRSCSSPRGIVAGSTSAALCSSPQALDDLL
ncbi:hypothetical protein BKA56DRAFT_269826 [Ilyonectria sp. MPI-CAGE-AT-0026]|nr:hypothetical protein BKA56DRAFT_269826 [Ilyonectria sp. MPI-CAGE-AT-0026]